MGIYTSLDPAGQEATRQLFLHLITLGEGVEDTRRWVLLSSLHPSSFTLLPLQEFGKYRLLTGSDDGLVLLWDVAGGDIVQWLDGRLASVLAVSFSPDGRWALSGSVDDTAVLWELGSGEIGQRLSGHKGDVSGVAFTPDGKRAVTSEDTAAAPSDLMVWDLASGDMLRRFGSSADGNREGILDMALSSDGRTALVGQFSFADTNERPLILWDVAAGTPIRRLPIKSAKRPFSFPLILPSMLSWCG